MEWADKCHVPTFDEYVLNGLGTSAYGVGMALFFLGLEEVAGVEYEWPKSNPKIIKAAKMIGRLMNDIADHEVRCLSSRYFRVQRFFMSSLFSDNYNVVFIIKANVHLLSVCY